MMGRREFLASAALAAGAHAGAPTRFHIACMTLPYAAFPLERALAGIARAGYRYVAWGVNHRDFGPLPVMVLKDATDQQVYKLIPGEVTVSLSGSPSVLDNLSSREIVAFVNLTGLQGASGFLKRVEVSAPGSVALYNVDPPAVRVERLSPLPAAGPSSRSKP